MVDLLVEKFDLMKVTSPDPVPVYVGWIKDKKHVGEKKRPLLSLSPPVAGMFVWVNCYIPLDVAPHLKYDLVPSAHRGAQGT